MNDLMQRRVKVIADYPNNPFKVGTVLTDTDWGGWLRYGERMLNLSMVKYYPHLFKELQWWEKRSLDEMPEYVKNENKVFKVIEWRHGALWIECRLIGLRGAHYPIDLNLTPATLEEYNLYIKTKQQNP
jgi:hypothetical protein